MAFYCLQMLKISLELARTVPAWDEVATKFLEHFLAIAQAMGRFGSQNVGLWDDEDGFYYDVLVKPDGSYERLRVRSMVGLLPLLAVASAPPWVAEELPDFTARLRWLARRRPALLEPFLVRSGPDGNHVLLSLLDADRLNRVLGHMFDEGEFLSPYGIRSLSAAYRTPYTTAVDGQPMTINYEPGESQVALFGGNSNWRGPVWFPPNVLLADALRTYGEYFGASYQQQADTIDQRLVDLFRPGAGGRRPSDGPHVNGPLWTVHPTFSEYFDGDTGEGLGASHQTGWTALVAHLLCRP
jgi:hypothetical protein